MSPTINLPPFPTDPLLRRDLPAHLDYRRFYRIPHNDRRYVIDCLTGDIWDIYRCTYLVPKPDADGRARYWINHANASARYVYGNVIAALTFKGPMLTPDDEAHHLDDNPTAPDANRWDNIIWQTPEQNRAQALKGQKQKRRPGESNGRSKLTEEQVIEFLRLYLDDVHNNRDVQWDLYASPFYFNVSTRTLRHIAKGETWTELVEKTKAAIMAERKTGK